MTRPHVVVVDPGVRRAETECFSALALRAPIALTYGLPAMNGPEFLAQETAARGLRGILVLGSATSVHDAPPWQPPLQQWLLAQAEAGIPTLAICYGHQLIAHALGGRVRFRQENHDKRVGLHRVSFTPSKLFPSRAEGELFFSHREIVESVPSMLKTIATGMEAGIEATEHERWPLWTVQAHPEATADFAARHGAPTPDDALAFGSRLIEGFFAKVRRD